MKRATTITYNWFYTTENGEEYTACYTSNENVDYIVCGQDASGKHSCEIYFTNGKYRTENNINTIVWEDKAI